MQRAGVLLTLLAIVGGARQLVATTVPLPAQSQDGEPVVLKPAARVEREISEGQAHAYVVDLTKGQFCFVAVDQHDVDVTVKVSGPEGRVLREVDGTAEASGTEFVYLIADTNGRFRFEVAVVAGGGKGRYQIALREQRLATGDDRQYLTEVARSDASRKDSELLSSVRPNKDLYPATADAAKEISEALEHARTTGKRVLLVFGGNWCYDCHVLDRALHEGAAGKILDESFLLVHVDIGEADKNLELVKTYKTTLDKGVPVVVILSSDGRLLYGSNDGEFEAARRMMKKDLVAFLLHWKYTGH